MKKHMNNGGGCVVFTQALSPPCCLFKAIVPPLSSLLTTKAVTESQGCSDEGTQKGMFDF